MPASTRSAAIIQATANRTPVESPPVPAPFPKGKGEPCIPPGRGPRYRVLGRRPMGFRERIAEGAGPTRRKSGTKGAAVFGSYPFTSWGNASRQRVIGRRERSGSGLEVHGRSRGVSSVTGRDRSVPREGDPIGPEHEKPGGRVYPRDTAALGTLRFRAVWFSPAVVVLLCSFSLFFGRPPACSESRSAAPRSPRALNTVPLREVTFT